MRYVCQTCGEAEMWQEGDSARFESGGTSETGSSDETHMARGLSDPGSTVYGGPAARPRSESTSTRASRDSVQTTVNGAIGDRRGSSGYELCPSCIESRGLEHSRAAAMVARHRLPPGEWARRAGELRHTFREKVWGSQGWQDVGGCSLLLLRLCDLTYSLWAEYNEDTQCTICSSIVLNDRYKCVSCNKFDLCESCQ